MAKKTIDHRLTDDQRAMVDANRGLVHAFVARAYGGKHPLYDDLVQAGMFGLMRAAQKYDPAKAKFSTYANYWIRSTTARFMDTDGVIQLPFHAANDARRGLGKHVEKVEAAKRTTWFDNSRDERHPVADADPALEAEAAEEREAELSRLREALARLTPRQREVVLRRAAGEQYKVIGESMGVCRERPRQMAREAIEILRAAMGVAS